MKEKWKRPKGVVMAVFWISLGRINLGEETATRELMRVVMEVTNRIAVRNGTGVQRSTVSAGTPTIVLLGHYVKCGGPRTLGAASSAISQHGVKFRFGNNEPVRC
jgi:hypothetical protein